MQLGTLEQQVMHFVWEHYPDTPFVVRDVVDGLQKQYAYNTILTVVTHLYDKQLLKRRKQGKSHAYTIRISKEEFVEHASRTLFNQLRKEYGDIAVAHFANIVEEMDPELIQKAQQQLSEDYAE